MSNDLTSKFFDDEKIDVGRFFDADEPPKQSKFDKYFLEPERKRAELEAASAETSRKAIPQVIGGGLEGLTLGAIDIFHPQSEEEGYAREIGRWYGLAGPISLAQKALRPLYNLARSSPIAPAALHALSRITGAATIGAGVKTAEDLIKTGELPDASEIAKEGAIWGAIDAGLQGLGVVGEFGMAIRNIAQKEGVSGREVLGRLWNSSKNYIKSKFGKEIKTPEDIKPQDIEILIGEAEKAVSEPEAPKALPEPKETKIEPVKEPEKVSPQDKFFPPEEPSESPIEMTEKQPAQSQQTTSKKNKSKVKSPLGSRQGKKFNKRPGESKLARKQPTIGKKQAQKRSKVIDLFRKAFTDPVIIGKKKMSLKKARGEHHLWSRVTRLLKANDVETAAHEIGHNLHTIMYEGGAKTPEEQRKNINKALNPYLDELTPLALYAPYGMEGFAEFVRLYVTNPDVAMEMAPKFYAKFTQDLEARFPDLKNALLEAREYYDTYLQGTPESRIRAQTDYGEDRTAFDSLKEWVDSNLDFDKLRLDWMDDVFPAKRLVAEAFGIPLNEVENLKDPRNLYRSLRTLKGAVGKGDVFLMHETFDPLTLKRKGRGLRQILRKLKTPEEYRELNDYLIARRSIEKTAQNIETGINPGDALIVEQKLRHKYGRIAKLLDQYNDALLTYAKDSGLMSGEQYKLIKDNNVLYTPFQRVIDKKEKAAASGGGKLQSVKPIKRMKGSSRDIIAPIESIVKNTYAIIINAEKNMAGKVLAELAEMKGVGRFVSQVPTPMELKAKISKQEIIKQLSKNLDFAEDEELLENLADAMPDFFLRFGPGTYPAGERIVTVFYNGKPKFFEVSEEMFDMWSKGIAPYTAELLTKIFRIPARTLRAGAILNPKFMLKNIVRDTWGSWIFTKYGKGIKDPVGLFIDSLYSPIAMTAVAAKKSKLYVQWLKSGGGMSTMQSLDRDSVVKKLQEVRDGLKPTQWVRWMRLVSEISEESNRLAEFGRALQVEADTRLGKEIAAFAARDLSIDFAKMGLKAKALNQVIPFWNAAVQGTNKLIRTLANPEDREEFAKRSIGWIVLPALIVAWLNYDDERVKEFYEEEKDFNFLFFIGGTALKIPVPFEAGVLLNGLTQRMFNYFMKHDPKAFEGFFGSIISAGMPSFIPAAANPIIEVMANKSFFTGAKIIPENKKRLISKYQYKNSTSVTARLLGRAMSYMLGEDTQAKAASPAVIDHFINSWGAGLGRQIVNIADWGLEQAGLGSDIVKPERTITERMGLDAFVARYPRASTRSIEKFYEMYGDATARHLSIKHAQKVELEEPEVIQRAYERVERLYDYNTLKRGYKAMQASQKAINAIYKNPDLDEKEKKEMIDDLYLQQIQFARAAVEDIEKHRLAGKKSS